MPQLRRIKGRARNGPLVTPLGGEKEDASVPSLSKFAPSKAQQRLLQACVTHRTTDSDTLGDLLCLSPETIRTHFKNICRETGFHERFAVVLFALESKLVVLPQALKLD